MLIFARRTIGRTKREKRLNDKYILTEDHRVVPEPDLLTWAHWFENAERHVAKDLIGPYFVSTVFLGLDHDFTSMFTANVRGPLVFETMLFDHSREQSSPWFDRKFHPSFNFQRRYRSWDEAKAGHDYAVKIAARMLRWMEFRSARQTREVGELNRLLEKS
jgi:hypothetical protein